MLRQVLSADKRFGLEILIWKSSAYNTDTVRSHAMDEILSWEHAQKEEKAQDTKY